MIAISSIILYCLIHKFRAEKYPISPKNIHSSVLQYFTEHAIFITRLFHHDRSGENVELLHTLLGKFHKQKNFVLENIYRSI